MYVSASITPHISSVIALTHLATLAICQLSTHYHRLLRRFFINECFPDLPTLQFTAMVEAPESKVKFSVKLLPHDLYVVKKCYLMLPGPLFFQPVFSIIWPYKQTQRQDWPHCVCRANDRGERNFGLNKKQKKKLQPRTVDWTQ